MPLLAAACALVAAIPADAQPAGEVLRQLQQFREMGRVLHVAAHPDDENTHLITYLVHERGFETAYLSMTRGEGGQNLIGDELGDALGMIRTHELLAAREIDGGTQFFTRAADFGYSKDYRETLVKWNHDRVLADVVRVIRTFRPHIIITRFAPEPVEGLHGHHTASALLAVEAFERAGDPNAFPEQLDRLEPWQPTRIVWNRWGNPPESNRPVLAVDIGGYSALAGYSFGEIAARSRSMHKSQGFGAIGSRGERVEHFVLLGGEAAADDLFDGIDASWSAFEGGEAIRSAIDEVIARFDPNAPSASVPSLLEVRRMLAALPDDDVIARKREQLDRIITASLGLHVETRIPRAEVIVGDTLHLTHAAIVRSDEPVRWVATEYPDGNRDVALDLPRNREAVWEAMRRLPPETQPGRPHWLAEGDARPDLTIKPTAPPAYPIRHIFEIGGQPLVVDDAPVQVIQDPVRGEVRHRMAVIPPVFLRFMDDILLIEPGGTAPARVEVTSMQRAASGMVRLDVPEGWSVTPGTQPFAIDADGNGREINFVLQAPAAVDRAEIVAEAVVDGGAYRSRREVIAYDHIPRTVMLPPARLVAVSADVATRGRAIGYVAGAGDRVSDALARMGFDVVELSAPDITPETLGRFDAVVLGIRALNTRTDLRNRMSTLFEYVREGGTLVAQYSTSWGLLVDPIAPLPLRLGRDRITDEEAELTPLAPDHPVLNQPNRITDTDFEGWIQERGLYFASSWDPAFTPILEGRDPGEEPVEGALLVAPFGRGHFVYTGLSFFRQLPAGVPGAYRLFANIVSLGR